MRRLACAPDFPPVLFVFQGTAEAAGPVFESLWPEARGVADTTLEIYRAFGLRRGTWKQLLAPAMWKRGQEAKHKGYGQGKTVTDPFLMSGAFLVQNRRVVRRHDYAHAGDLPDFAALVSRT